MDWYPLYNSIRVAVVATLAVFFLGIWAAVRVSRLPWPVRCALDTVLSLPLVLPPAAAGWLLLRFFGPRHPIGYWTRALFVVRLVMTWQAAALAGAIAAFPLMYRAARRAFAEFDVDLEDAARTLGRSNVWTFWMVRVPVCRHGLLAGTALSFARAAGEFGAVIMAAGYAPGSTATVSTAIYEFWRAGDNAGALRWVLISLFLSAVCMAAASLLENGGTRNREKGEERLWN